MKSKYSKGNIFSNVQVEKFPRHLFNLGYFNKFTCNHGYAVPFFVDDVVPGDKIDCKTFGRVQLLPLASSSMQNIKCYFRYFYVPYRLLWENWDKFMTQDPESDTAILAPYFSLNQSNLNAYNKRVGNLLDMLGVNLTNIEDGRIVDYRPDANVCFTAFRFLAYNLIWDYYFRDENLQEPLTDGPIETNGYLSLTSHNWSKLLPVAYEKDYFTTALPWPQKGEPVNLSSTLLDSSPQFMDSSGQVYDLMARNNLNYSDENGQKILGYAVLEGEPPLTVSDGSLKSLNFVPESITTSFNINDLRYSNALQRFLERKALGGSRPAEFYLSMYGVRIDDLRIGQPLYLGGGSTNISITDVASTAYTQRDVGGTIRDIPQGTLAGNGKSFPVVSMNNPYYCQEFGVVMGIMYIRPEMNYSQGLPKEMQLFRTLDFYNPVFAHLGEEAVMKSELVLAPNLDNSPTDATRNNDSIFGYQSRYAYKKYKRNEVHGDFKTTLRQWVLSPYLPINVELNDEFITVDQDYSIFAVVDETYHHYIVELYNDYQKESSMPNFVIPSL